MRMTITLEDVDIAIKILNEFLKQARRAESTLKRFQAYIGRSGGSMPLSMERFVQMAFETIQAQKQAQLETTQEPIEEELTEEELKKIREIISRNKK